MSSSSGARVLLVVPTLGNRLETLGRTLSSIVSQRGVTVDCVVVAPAEVDGLREVVAAHGAQLLLRSGHISAAVNEGFACAGDTHQYLAWLGDDDELKPGALERSAARMGDRPEAVVAFGDCDYVDAAGELLFTRRPPLGAPWLLQLVPGLIKQEACLFRREAVVRVGGLDEALRYAMDLDLLLRLRRIGPFVRVRAVQAAFCWHEGSITVANRSLSFSEAQQVQRRRDGLSGRTVGWLVRPIIRQLVLAMSARINRRQPRHG